MLGRHDRARGGREREKISTQLAPPPPPPTLMAIFIGVIDCSSTCCLAALP